METVGIIRKFDTLGRIVVPKEIRDHLDIDEKTPIEISQVGNDIILRKQQSACVFCGSQKNLYDYLGKCVCEKCCEYLAKEKEFWK